MHPFDMISRIQLNATDSSKHQTITDWWPNYSVIKGSLWWHHALHRLVHSLQWMETSQALSSLDDAAQTPLTTRQHLRCLYSIVSFHRKTYPFGFCKVPPKIGFKKEKQVCKKKQLSRKYWGHPSSDVFTTRKSVRGSIANWELDYFKETVADQGSTSVRW